jgi:PAS domain S-box-containing protein
VASADDLRFQAVNPMFAAMHGYSAEELIGAPLSTVWTEETRADMDNHAGVAHDQGRLVVETMHRRKDGTLLPVEIVATNIKDAAQKERWFVANVNDITERRRHQQSQLRAVRLEAEHRRMEEANRLKSEFLASMSHELRTPLNSVIGFAELMFDGHVGSVTDKQQEFLGDILAGGRHLLRLINEVLDLAKVEAGKMEFRPEPSDLEQLASAVVQSLRATALSKKLDVTLTVAPALDDIVLDPGRFKQILYNYLSNALKFTPDGGGVGVRLDAEGEDRFRLEVEDTGPGISNEDMPRLFTAFQQLDTGAAKRHGGTGLGLALTKQLVEAQGGTVGVRAAVPRGSVFFAVLPRRPPELAPPRARPSGIRGAASVLVVERNSEDRRALVSSLKEAGYDVDAVSTCRAAQTAWASRSYDALALDLLDREGDDLWGLLRLVHQTPTRSSTPVIAMTLIGDRQAPVGFAVSDVLEKPVEPAALLAALKRSGVPPARGRPVFVIDDDASSVKLMEATLAKLGYESQSFSDARDALRATSTTCPLAVILDLVMPAMDGLSFLRRFRATPENSAIPVMVWTVKDLSREEHDRLQAAATAVVQKGVTDSSRLAVALQQFLETRGLAKQVG